MVSICIGPRLCGTVVGAIPDLHCNSGSGGYINSNHISSDIAPVLTTTGVQAKFCAGELNFSVSAVDSPTLNFASVAILATSFVS